MKPKVAIGGGAGCRGGGRKFVKGSYVGGLQEGSAVNWSQGV